MNPKTNNSKKETNTTENIFNIFDEWKSLCQTCV